MKFKDIYSASLCKNGILGGWICLKETELIYSTNKLTVPEKIKRLHMPYDDVLKIRNAPFYTVEVFMKNGEVYRFIVFTRKRFLRKIMEKQGDISLTGARHE